MSLGKSLRRSWATVVTVCLILSLVLYVDGKQAGALMQVSCSENAAFAGKEVGDIISVYSDGYPNYEKDISQPGCKISLESCLRCRFRVEIQADFPVCTTGPLTTSKNNCPKQGCRTLLIYDTVYSATKAVRVLGGQDSYPSIFMTTSNFITLDYCKYMLTGNVKFNITIYIVEKETVYNMENGLIVSPNFPFGYYARKEIYTYTIQSPSDKNHSLLQFADWELNQNADSELRIESFTNGVSTAQHKFYAKDFRPMLFLTGNQVNLTFSAGSTQGSLSSGDRYHGFKMQYEFTNAMRVDLPKTDCGEYFSMSKGAGGEIMLYRNRQSDNVDCIWVIMRPPQFTNLMVKMETHSYSPSYMSPTMTIYGGMTSNGMPLVVEEHLSVIGTRYTTADGLFIRLQGKVDRIDIKMVYMSYVRPTMGQCQAPTALCTNLGNVCISGALLSSGWDSATRCGTKSLPTESSCGWLVCKDGKTCFSRCDGIADCPDKADEYDCPAGGKEGQSSFNVQIVVPVLVLFLGVPIIVIPIFLIIKHCVKRRGNQRVRRRRRSLLRQYANNGRDREDHDNPAFHLENDGVYRRPGTTSIPDDRHIGTPTIRGIPPPSYHTIVSPLDEREQFLLRDQPPSYSAVLSHPSSYRLSVVETKPTNMELPPDYESVAHIQTQLFSDAQRQSVDADETTGRRSPGAANPDAEQPNYGTSDGQPTLLQRLSLWTMMPWLNGSGANGVANGTVSQGHNPVERARRVSDPLGNQANIPFTISHGYSLDSSAPLPRNGASRPVALRSLPEGQRSNSQGRINPGQEQPSSEGAYNRDSHERGSNNHLRRLAAHGRQFSDPNGILGCNSGDHNSASASVLPGMSHGRSASLDSTNSPGQVRSCHSPVPFPWKSRDSPRGSMRNDAGRVTENDPGSEFQRSRGRERDTSASARMVPQAYRPPRSISYRTPSANEELSAPARRAGSEFSVASRPGPRRNSRDLGGGLSRYRNRPLHSSLSNLSRSSDLEDPHQGSVSSDGNSLGQDMPQLSQNVSSRKRQGSLPSLLHESVHDMNSPSSESVGRPVAAVRKNLPVSRTTASHAMSNTSQVRPPVAPKPRARLSRSHIPGGSQSNESTSGPRSMDVTKHDELGESGSDSRRTLQGRGSASLDDVPLAFVESRQGDVAIESDVGSSATYV